LDVSQLAAKHGFLSLFDSQSTNASDASQLCV
jgi:hypothetical protein